MLVHPNPESPFVAASASGVRVYYPSNTQSTIDSTPAPFSQRLTPAKANYYVGNRAILAIVLALLEWCHWLEGAKEPFTIFTDRKNLSYIRSAKRMNSRQARWARPFTRFNFTVTYRPGSPNKKPDALFRLHDPAVDETRTEAVRKLFVPAEFRSEVLQWGHASNVAQHSGVSRTLALINQRFWWTQLNKDVKDCSVCACGKMSRRPPAGFLLPLPVPSRPWSPIVTGRSVSQGKSVIPIVVDRFLKMANFLARPKLPLSFKIAQLLICHVYRLHCIPMGLNLCLKFGKGFKDPWEAQPAALQDITRSQMVRARGST